MKKLHLLLPVAGLLCMLCACATSTGAASAPTRPSRNPSPIQLETAPLGTPGCHPPSPVAPSALGGWEVHGTTMSGGATTQVWALLMPTGPLPIHPHESVKIVWKMTGSGALSLVGTGPGGVSLAPTSGPQRHGDSNWTRPGDEWGSEFAFPMAGCWGLRASRGEASGVVWLEVR